MEVAKIRLTWKARMSWEGHLKMKRDEIGNNGESESNGHTDPWPSLERLHRYANVDSLSRSCTPLTRTFYCFGGLLDLLILKHAHKSSNYTTRNHKFLLTSRPWFAFERSHALTQLSMCIRAVHAETTLRVLRQLIRAKPLRLLTTAIDSTGHPFLQSNPIRSRRRRRRKRQRNGATPGPPRVAEPPQQGHDPGAHLLSEEAQYPRRPRRLHGPAPRHHAPLLHGQDVELHRRARVYFDSAEEATVGFLGQQISDLTRHDETTPARYTDILKKNIIGLEIEVVRLECKSKMSQEMGSGDREGGVDGFYGLQSDIGRQIGDIVKQRGELSADNGNGILLCVCFSAGAVGDASQHIWRVRVPSPYLGLVRLAFPALVMSFIQSPITNIQLINNADLGGQ
ncbi:hypothetical protein CCMSSC00406_0008828 [Pleurotus cornucopiae]|uniref:Uncharacterized protein n=1 Tax=Pleurotus cornucopiae TaxID=5321 RepID=A0ACB7IJK9_PLECO|nr:hypothetical protein CCMSSC00406_0008828 [Pleurotus cornucopiae]